MNECPVDIQSRDRLFRRKAIPANMFLNYTSLLKGALFVGRQIEGDRRGLLRKLYKIIFLSLFYCFFIVK